MPLPRSSPQWSVWRRRSLARGRNRRPILTILHRAIRTDEQRPAPVHLLEHGPHGDVRVPAPPGRTVDPPPEFALCVSPHPLLPAPLAEGAWVFQVRAVSTCPLPGRDTRPGPLHGRSDRPGHDDHLWARCAVQRRHPGFRLYQHGGRNLRMQSSPGRGGPAGGSPRAGSRMRRGSSPTVPMSSRPCRRRRQKQSRRHARVIRAFEIDTISRPKPPSPGGPGDTTAATVNFLFLAPGAAEFPLPPRRRRLGSPAARLGPTRPLASGPHQFRGHRRSMRPETRIRLPPATPGRCCSRASLFI